MAAVEKIIIGGEREITVDQVVPGGLYCRMIKEYKAMHFGIGVENGEIIDLNNGRDEQSIRQISFVEFARGIPVYQVDCSSHIYGSHCRSHEETVAKAKESLAIRRPYNLFFYNCGMFAFYCKLKTDNPIEKIHPLIGQQPPLPLVRY